MSTRRHPRRKTGTGRFAKLPLTVLNSAAVTTLNHAHFRVMVYLTAEFSGYNNGALGLSKSQAASQNISNKTLYKALATLEEHGQIEQTYPASRVPPRPTMYALTWMPVDDTSWSQSTQIPAHTYRDWQPSRKPKLRVVRNKRKAAG